MSSKTQLANKNSKTVKSRITWMSRTSDIVGSHMNTDLDSYLTLIRRKIQEKMSTTVELITQIRRFKVGETSHVTPNEFRYTLIKFGIILPQPLVDKIFSVFDSDRSGTMDFDEFAMWIMNSEFQPTLKNKGVSSEDTPRTVHRKKFGSILKENPAWLRGVKTQISFIEFVADINRMNLNISDKEARSIFRIIDGRDSGFVDARVLIRWAETGVVDNSVMQESKPASSAPKDLNKLVAEVIGRNTKQLESAFSHVPRGQSIRITFDEFRRCLLNAGVGKNSYGCKQVFNALGGSKDGLADIDLLFKTLAPVITDPTSEVSAKHTPSNTINTSRADRRLRDAMRKSYKEVKQDIDLADPSNSGYIDADKLFRILIKRCLPLTFQDFRFIIQNVRQ